MRYFDRIVIAVFPVAIGTADILAGNDAFSFLLEYLEGSHSVAGAAKFDGTRRVFNYIFVFLIWEFFDFDLKYFVVLVVEEFREKHDFLEESPNRKQVSFFNFLILPHWAIAKHHFIVFSHFRQDLPRKQCFVFEVVEKLLYILGAFVLPGRQ